MKENISKIITVTLNIQDIKNDTFFFSIPDDTYDNKSIMNILKEKYETLSGNLKITDNNDDKFILQWSPKEVNQRAEAFHLEAIEFSRLNQKEKAMELWDKALNLNNLDVDYLYRLSLTCFELKIYNKAISHLEKIINICPIHYRANLLLGIIFIKIRKFSKAEDYLLASKRLNKTDILCYLNLGAVYSVNKQFNDAIKMFKKVIELAPNECRAYLGMAKIYMMLNDIDTSNNYFRKIIELSPGSKIADYAKRSIKLKDEMISTKQNKIKHIEDYIVNGIRNFLSGNYQYAGKLYKEYLHKKPSDDYAWYLLGESQLRNGQIESAADCFKRAIKLNSNRKLYYKSLGITFHYLNKSNEVIDILKKYLQMKKYDHLCFTILGIQYIHLKKFDKAIEFLEKALKICKNNPLAKFNLALALVKVNRPNNALQILKGFDQINLFIPIKNKVKRLINSLTSDM